jgi:pimeloyl-ACP methyl ester carboxylesterase
MEYADAAPFIAQTGRRVIVPDLRGRGLSAYDPEPMNYVPSVYADDVIGLLYALGIGRAIFIGKSLGGMVTLFVAAKSGNQVAAAILNDVGPEVGEAGLARISRHAGQPYNVKTWDDAVNYIRTMSGIAFPKYSDDEWRAVARRAFHEDETGRPVRVYDQAISVPIKAGKMVVPPERVWSLFKNLTRNHPTLAIRGALSDVLTPETASRMREVAPSMSYAEIEDVGHAPLLTEPQAKRVVLEFLDSVP